MTCSRTSSPGSSSPRSLRGATRGSGHHSSSPRSSLSHFASGYHHGTHWPPVNMGHCPSRRRRAAHRVHCHAPRRQPVPQTRLRTALCRDCFTFRHRLLPLATHWHDEPHVLARLDLTVDYQGFYRSTDRWPAVVATIATWIVIGIDRCVVSGQSMELDDSWLGD